MNNLLIIYKDKIQILENKGVLNKVRKKFEFLSRYFKITLLSPDKWKLNGIKSKRFFSYFDFILFLVLNGKKYDIIKSYDTSIHSLIAIIICKFLLKKPIIVTSHGHVEHLVYKSKLKHKIRIIIDRFVLSNSTAVFAASRSLQNFCKKFNNYVYFVPTWGIDEEIFIYGGKKQVEKNKIIYIGRIEPVKRIDFLIESYLSSSLKEKGISFYLIGPIFNIGYFKDLSIRYKNFINKYVFFTGGVSQDKLPSYFKSSYCLFMGSKTEGLPNPVLESLAMKVPVVTTRVGDVTTLIIEGINGYTYPLHSSVEEVGKFLDKVCEINDIPDEYSINIAKNYISTVSNENEIQYIQEILKK
jgi:glycosyltransferase involved in cell wall biosynthesis